MNLSTAVSIPPASLQTTVQATPRNGSTNETIHRGAEPIPKVIVRRKKTEKPLFQRTVMNITNVMKRQRAQAASAGLIQAKLEPIVVRLGDSYRFNEQTVVLSTGGIKAMMLRLGFENASNLPVQYTCMHSSSGRMTSMAPQGVIPPMSGICRNMAYIPIEPTDQDYRNGDVLLVEWQYLCLKREAADVREPPKVTETDKQDGEEDFLKDVRVPALIAPEPRKYYSRLNITYA